MVVPGAITAQLINILESLHVHVKLSLSGDVRAHGIWRCGVDSDNLGGDEGRKKCLKQKAPLGL